MLQVESSKLALERESAQATAAKTQLAAAQHELDDTQHHISRRLAVVRWQFAGVCLSGTCNTNTVLHHILFCSTFQQPEASCQRR